MVFRVRAGGPMRGAGLFEYCFCRRADGTEHRRLSRHPGLPARAILAALLAAPAFDCAPAAATEPGAKLAPEEERDLTADLYVSAIGSQNRTLTGVALAWVPPEYEGICLGKTYDECWNIARNDRAERGEPDTLPPRVMHDWLSEADHQGRDRPALTALSRCTCIGGALTEDHREEKRTLSKDCMVRAELHYTLWPNGEGFEVLRARCKK